MTGKQPPQDICKLCSSVTLDTLLMCGSLLGGGGGGGDLMSELGLWLEPSKCSVIGIKFSHTFLMCLLFKACPLCVCVVCV